MLKLLQDGQPSSDHSKVILILNPLGLPDAALSALGKRFNALPPDSLQASEANIHVPPPLLLVKATQRLQPPPME